MIVGLAAVLLQSPAARAQDADSTATPSPKELWEAYPLAPEDAPATATPSEAATEGSGTPPASSATPAPSGAAASSGDDDGGIPLAVPIGLAAVLAFGAGVGFGRVRRRERLERAEAVEALPVEPPAPKRFEWRDYPEPARPAPPAPPPPAPAVGNGAFKAALEAKRAAGSTQAKQEEPH